MLGQKQVDPHQDQGQDLNQGLELPALRLQIHLNALAGKQEGHDDRV